MDSQTTINNKNNTQCHFQKNTFLKKIHKNFFRTSEMSKPQSCPHIMHTITNQTELGVILPLDLRDSVPCWSNQQQITC